MIFKRSVFIILFSCLLNSCAYNGGGTYGTGLPLGSRATKEAKTGVSYIELTVRILSNVGRPLENATVTISTPQMDESGTTDFNGMVNVNLICKANETISVRIENGPTTYSTTINPTGPDLSSGSATFTLQNGGKVKVSDQKWLR